MLPSHSDHGDAHRVLAIQTILVAAVAMAFLVARGTAPAQAASYGGLVAVLSTWMLGRRVRMAIEAAREHPGHETAVLYAGAVQRFVLVLALFAAGMGWLELAPVPLLAGFAVAQAAIFLTGGVRARAAREPVGDA